MRFTPPTRALTVLGLCAVLLAGCSLPSIPSDPDGTLERVRSERVLRAGASPNAPLVLAEAGGPPTGPEVELVEGFAQSVGARVEWVVGGESELVGRMEDGEIDVLAGGLLKDSPWEKRVTLTRPYGKAEADDGTTRAHVLATPMGENALLTELERYLDEHGSEHGSEHGGAQNGAAAGGEHAGVSS
ncbi:transporter substrate-binding domain-containing protein [Mobilicoccus massiliensis]|uniref:transporter substrate-binding domain-containing protein n=1 Tax=Mobilicoccus massiliensis TaxID=1522310 RepID=UPI001141A7AB|nr:transporter substrate-binding domain-containing protein [Mobilicoccus massiliensis]